MSSMGLAPPPPNEPAFETGPRPSKAQVLPYILQEDKEYRGVRACVLRMQHSPSDLYSWAADSWTSATMAATVDSSLYSGAAFKDTLPRSRTIPPPRAIGRMITGADKFREALKRGMNFLGLSCTGTMVCCGDGLDFFAACEKEMHAHVNICSCMGE